MGIGKSRDKTGSDSSNHKAWLIDFRHTSPSPLPSTFKTPMSIAPDPRLGRILMLAVALCATPTPAYSHHFFFSSTDAILLSSCAWPRCYIWSHTIVLTLHSRSRHPPSPSLAPVLLTAICCCLKTLFIYFLGKAPYVSFCRVTTALVHTRSCCPPTLHFFGVGEGAVCC